MAALHDTRDRSFATNLTAVLTALVLAMILLSGVLAAGAYAVQWAWSLGG